MLHGVRFYTGIHDPNKEPEKHAAMAWRLYGYQADGVEIIALPLRYDQSGRARQKGVDSRICLDILRLGQKGVFDIATIISEDSDIDPAVQDLYGLRGGAPGGGARTWLGPTPAVNCARVAARRPGRTTNTSWDTTRKCTMALPVLSCSRPWAARSGPDA